MAEVDIDLSLVIPAYNEGFRIAATLDTVEAWLRESGRTFEVLVVDDGSADDTLQVARERAGRSSGIQVLAHDHNLGKGRAVRTGVAASSGALVAFSDADLSVPIEDLDRLLAAMSNRADIAIGSRGLRDSEILAHQPFYRELGGKALNLVIQLTALPGIWDTQCGFKLLRGDDARDIFSRCILDGWGFDVELLYLARRKGLRIAEVPVRWRHGERSKLHPLAGALQILRDILRVRTHDYGI